MVRRNGRFGRSSLMWLLAVCIACGNVGFRYFLWHQHDQGGGIEEAHDRFLAPARSESVAGSSSKGRVKSADGNLEPRRSKSPAGDQPMNVLFIVADDLRPELGLYGRSAITPNLDRLAARGVTFDRAYAQTTVCNPSRVSFMTGRKPDVTKVWHFEYPGPPTWTSVPLLFSSNGFLTAGTGKLWHMPNGPGKQWPHVLNVTGKPYFPNSHQFQPLIQTERGLQNATVTPVPDEERYLSPANEFIDVQFADRAVHALRELVRMTSRTEDTGTPRGGGGGGVQGDKERGGGGSRADTSGSSGRGGGGGVQQQQHEHAQQQPWFLGVGFHMPHEPYVFPKAFWDLYEYEEEHGEGGGSGESNKKRAHPASVGKRSRRRPVTATATTTPTEDGKDGKDEGEGGGRLTTLSPSPLLLPYCPVPWAPDHAPDYARGDAQTPFSLLYQTDGMWSHEHYCGRQERALKQQQQHRQAETEKQRRRSREQERRATAGAGLGGEGASLGVLGEDTIPLEAFTLPCSVTAIREHYKKWGRLQYDMGRHRQLRRKQQQQQQQQGKGSVTVGNQLNNEHWPFEPRPPMPFAVQQELLRGYMAGVSFMDHQVGRVLSELALLGVADTTAVVFTSDHGFSLGDHGQWGKRSLHEVDCRVPLVVADPTRPNGHGTRSKALVELVDVLPTLAHLGGLTEQAVSAALQGPPLSGGSLVPLLNPPASTSTSTSTGGGSEAQSVATTTNGAVRHSLASGEKRRVEANEEYRSEHRAASVTQFVRCPVTVDSKAKTGGSSGGKNDFRTGSTSAIQNACVRTVRGWRWYEKHALVVMGYSVRTARWRYSAWMLWDPNTTQPLWRYPPLGEQLFDHRLDTSARGFDDFEREHFDDDDDDVSNPYPPSESRSSGNGGGNRRPVDRGRSLAFQARTGPLRWRLYLALKALVQGDTAHELRGGRNLGVGGLAEMGLCAFPWRSNPSATTALKSDVVDGGGGVGAEDDDGLLPRWLEVQLDTIGMLPPTHEQVTTHARETRLTPTVNSTRRSEAPLSAARSLLESAGLLWPLPFQGDFDRSGHDEPHGLGFSSEGGFFGVPWGDRAMLAFEPSVRVGDLLLVSLALQRDELWASSVGGGVEEGAAQGGVGVGGDGLWVECVVMDVLPRVTLRGEVGAALVLEKSGATKLTTPRGTVAEAASANSGGSDSGGGSGRIRRAREGCSSSSSSGDDGVDFLFSEEFAEAFLFRGARAESALFVPSRIWPEEEGKVEQWRGWKKGEGDRQQHGGGGGGGGVAVAATRRAAREGVASGSEVAGRRLRWRPASTAVAGALEERRKQSVERTVSAASKREVARGGGKESRDAAAAAAANSIAQPGIGFDLKSLSQRIADSMSASKMLQKNWKKRAQSA